MIEECDETLYGKICLDCFGHQHGLIEFRTVRFRPVCIFRLRSIVSTAQLFHCERRPILPQQSETGFSPAADADWTKENKTMVRGRRQRWRAAVASQEMIYRLDRKQLTAQLCTISRTLELKSCKSSPEGESGCYMLTRTH